MSEITNLIKNGKETYSVFLDGCFFCKLNAETIAPLGYTWGMALPPGLRRIPPLDLAFSSALIYEAIKEAPAADVVEVVHAYWNKDPVTGVKLCSNCKAPPPGDAELKEFYESNYCPCCGAKMDGKK